MKAQIVGSGARSRRRPAQRVLFPVVALAVLCGAVSAGCSRSIAPPQEEDAVHAVSLAPSLTEIVFAIGAGDRLVGRTDACDYPPEAAGVPIVGAFGRPSVERVLTAGATLVLDADLEDAALRGEFRRYGLQAHRVACGRLSEIPAAIRDVGRHMAAAEAAAALADGIEAGIHRMRQAAGERPDGTRPRVFIELWPDPLMTVGSESFIHDVVDLAGGRNAAAGVARDYFTVDPEWVLARDPEIILLLHGADGETARKTVAARTGWGGLAAVRSGRIVSGIDPSLLQRPGPRILEGAAALQRAFFPDEAVP